MGCRTYDRELECGCLISSDGGGGLISCHYGCGCGKEGCERGNECNDCLAQEEKCRKARKKWRKV